MKHQNLLYKNKPIKIHKATIKPIFNSKSILVENPWEYVELFIKREKNESALFYWQQSNSFYKATEMLPKTAAPLTAYYCLLNASKALLELKKINYSDKHGVTGYTTGNTTSLSNEIVKFLNHGVLFELGKLLDEKVNGEKYTFKELIYNLVYIHRAYQLTYSTDVELFFPIDKPEFSKLNGKEDTFIRSKISNPLYQNERTIKKLPNGFERDLGSHNDYFIRKKKRFKWKRGKINETVNLEEITKYNRSIRKHLHYIHGTNELWYFKRKCNTNNIEKGLLTITFALMHRLSELSRYHPAKLKKHFDTRHNWLLTEFINLAPKQFIYAIATEISGNEFKVPGIRF